MQLYKAHFMKYVNKVFHFFLKLFFYEFQVFKMLGNKESLDQIIVASPGLSSDPVALGKSKIIHQHSRSIFGLYVQIN